MAASGSSTASAVRRLLPRESNLQETQRLLTPREVEIVRMVAQGLPNRAIGERLHISEGTVKVHVHNIYEKLGVGGRAELIVWARNKGLA